VLSIIPVSVLHVMILEILWSTTGRRLHLLPKSPLRVGTDEVMPASVVRDLGIYIDSDARMHIRHHVRFCITCETVAV